MIQTPAETQVCAIIAFINKRRNSILSGTQDTSSKMPARAEFDAVTDVDGRLLVADLRTRPARCARRCGVSALVERIVGVVRAFRGGDGGARPACRCMHVCAHASFLCSCMCVYVLINV
jgi:hypothetical protein